MASQIPPPPQPPLVLSSAPTTFPHQTIEKLDDKKFLHWRQLLNVTGLAHSFYYSVIVSIFK